LSIKGFNIDGNIEKYDYDALENRPCYSEYKTITTIFEGYWNGERIYTDNDYSTTSEPVGSGITYNLVIGDTVIPITLSSMDDYGYEYATSGTYEDIEYNISIYTDCCYDTSVHGTLTGVEEGTNVAITYVEDYIPIIPKGTYTIPDGESISFKLGNLSTYPNSVFTLSIDDKAYEHTMPETDNVALDFTITTEDYSLTIYPNDNEVILGGLTPGEHTIALCRTFVLEETIFKVEHKYLDVPYTRNSNSTTSFFDDVYVKNMSVYDCLVSPKIRAGTGTASEMFNDGRNKATANYAHAEGQQTTASGHGSHAEGGGTKADSNYSHAEGEHTTASGQGSHAEGVYTTASGSGSHAEGNRTTASEYGSHAEGDESVSSGRGSHAEGSSTASANYAHAEGSSTASGWGSHAEGNSTASGIYAHAEGYHTTASGDYSHTQGKCNIIDENNKYAHIVGNGTDKDNPSNAHTLDWDGNAWYAGHVEATHIILKSSTEGSTKRFKVTVDDSGTISATEITE
jgi:hypothetical protein